MRNTAPNSLKKLRPSTAAFQLFPFGLRAKARYGQIPKLAPPCSTRCRVPALLLLESTRRRNKASPFPLHAYPPLPADPALHPAPATRRQASATIIPVPRNPPAAY